MKKSNLTSYLNLGFILFIVTVVMILAVNFYFGWSDIATSKWHAISIAIVNLTKSIALIVFFYPLLVIYVNFVKEYDFTERSKRAKQVIDNIFKNIKDREAMAKAKEDIEDEQRRVQAQKEHEIRKMEALNNLKKRIKDLIEKIEEPSDEDHCKECPHTECPEHPQHPDNIKKEEVKPEEVKQEVVEPNPQPKPEAQPLTEPAIVSTQEPVGECPQPEQGPGQEEKSDILPQSCDGPCSCTGPCHCKEGDNINVSGNVSESWKEKLRDEENK